MLSEAKAQALQDFLGTLPGQTVLRLVKAVELDSLSDGILPHAAILDILRPVLRKSEIHERLPTPLRYFCLPFDDFLFGGPRKEKRKGCISRSAIVPLWNWLAWKLIPETLKTYIADFKAQVLIGNLDACSDLAVAFWAQSGRAIAEAFATAPDAAREYFASDALAADVEEIGLLLCAGPLMMEIKALFAKSSAAPSEPQMSAFREIYERAVGKQPDAAPYLPVAAMGRLEKPWQALRLALLVSRRRSDTLISSTDMGLVGDILFARMEAARAEIHAMHQPDFDPDELIDRLTDFTLLSSAITKEADILRGGKWAKRLFANRSAISSVMESYMERAPREIATVLPMKRSQGGIMPLVPDFEKTVDDEKVIRACRYARLIAGCKYLASAAAFANKHKEAVKAATDLLCFYNEALVRVLYAARNAPLDRDTDRRFKAAVALTRLLLSAEEAELLNRRGEMALAA
jgi:hypothetical protein